MTNTKSAPFYLEDETNVDVALKIGFMQPNAGKGDGYMEIVGARETIRRDARRIVNVTTK